MKIIPVDEYEVPPVNNPQIPPRPRSNIPTLIMNNKMPRGPFISDPSIVPRVQKYLESNVNKTYVDIDVMADDLQKMYKDYARRKRIPFRSSVKKAYGVVLKNYGLNENLSSSEECTEESAGEEPQFGDYLSNQLLDMYNQQSRKPLDDNELIDISSDDSNDNTTPSNARPANGASTSQKPRHNLYPVSITATKKNINPITLNRGMQMEPVSNTEQENNREKENERGKKRKGEFKENVAPVQPTMKRRKPISTLQAATITFKDVGGLDKVLEHVCKLLVHVSHPEVYKQIGITPPRGFLLHGPPGCGKTLLANAIAGELNIPLLKIAGPELIGGVSGESEERIRNLFDQAITSAPCVLFIDEVDAIIPNRQNAQKEMERRIVAQFLSCLDDLSQNENGNRVLVIGATNRPDTIDPALRRAGRFDREVCLGIPDLPARIEILKVLTAKLKLEEGFDYTSIGKYTPGFVGADLMALARESAMAAVNRVFNSIKEKRELEKAMALQKASQALLLKKQNAESIKAEADSSKPIVVANEDEVSDSLGNGDNAIVVIDDDPKSDKADTESTPAPPNLNEEDSEKLQKALQILHPPESVLEGLISWLHERAPLTKEQLSQLHITMDDFAVALKVVQPSAKREGFATVPDVTWDDIGSLRNVREELQMAILAPIQHADQFNALGLTTPTGVLLCGPPGCGKTLLAKAIANEAGINFISVKGPELLNMYVGESEKAVRVCFERARNSAPCVIFFDELDSLCPKRSETGEGGVTMRLVNQMLTEMDGIESRTGVYLLAATNRPDIIDPAVLRPGRLDKIIYVGLPSAEDRVDILRTITKNGTKPQLAPDVDLEVIGKAEQCDGYTGADLSALVREAGIQALKEFMLQTDQKQTPLVTTIHFKLAVAKIRPSITEKDQKHYEKLKKIYSVAVDGDVEEMEYS
ncbi:hypothetical protein PPYR_10711 [Photinus pyralis]|uniref:AAA+ ATPase domain-containing protein n=1 Tax=Photinus pyralis TaxID=7054 RepID=A0A1Y1NHJ3_PHOPY|nr:nuclear valosin-containing protein-like [Photinus pyralis]KAB0796650.1 hypothetical protein PPYR_10711 [Photinus pyralis]